MLFSSAKLTWNIALLVENWQVAWLDIRLILKSMFSLESKLKYLENNYLRIFIKLQKVTGGGNCWWDSIQLYEM